MNGSGEITLIIYDDMGKVKKGFDHMEIVKVDKYLKKLKSSKSKAQTKALRKQQKASRRRNRKG